MDFTSFCRPALVAAAVEAAVTGGIGDHRRRCSSLAQLADLGLHQHMLAGLAQRSFVHVRKGLGWTDLDCKHSLIVKHSHSVVPSAGSNPEWSSVLFGHPRLRIVKIHTQVASEWWYN